MAIVARLRTGYSMGHLSGNELSLEAPGILDDGRELACVVARATKKQRINNPTVQDCSKTLTTLEVIFLLRERGSERSVVAALAGAGLEEYRREDIATMRCNEAVLAHTRRHGGECEPWPEGVFKCQEERRPTKRANLFPVQIQCTIRRTFLLTVKSTYLSLYFLRSRPHILPWCQLPPSVANLSTHIYPNLE